MKRGNVNGALVDAHVRHLRLWGSFQCVLPVKWSILTGNKLLQMNRPVLPRLYKNDHLILPGSTKKGRVWKGWMQEQILLTVWVSGEEDGPSHTTATDKRGQSSTAKALRGFCLHPTANLETTWFLSGPVYSIGWKEGKSSHFTLATYYEWAVNSEAQIDDWCFLSFLCRWGIRHVEMYSIRHIVNHIKYWTHIQKYFCHIVHI